MLSLSLQCQQRHSIADMFKPLRSAVPKVFGLSLTLATVILVVVASFNSWDHFFFTFFKTFQTLVLGKRVSVRLHLLHFYQA